MLDTNPNGGVLMKTISIFLALINSLMAGLLIALSISGSEIRETVTWWLLIKVLTAITVIVIGGLTLLGGMRTVNHILTSLSSLFLVALGAATSVWTLHLGLTTGDMEYYMILYGGSLLIQGVASLFGVLQESEGPMTA
jgi:hypothetical protein